MIFTFIPDFAYLNKEAMSPVIYGSATPLIIACPLQEYEGK
jgi:hypothetical protein